MIVRVSFRRKLRDVFKRGDAFAVRPLTVLVGDNGCGKSTFLRAVLDCVREDGGEHPAASVKDSGRRLDRYVFADFEKDNCRVQSDFDRAGAYGLFSMTAMSHGETVMDQLVNGISRLSGALVLLDEPDQCLSPRSSYRAFRMLEGLVKQNGCQVVMACHSVLFMELAGEVLSLEHRRWMPYRDFLKLEAEPAPLRWVDKDVDGFKDPAVMVRLSNGEERYLSDNSDVLTTPGLTRRSSFARTFRSREAAQRRADAVIGRKFMVENGMFDMERVVVESARVVMLNRIF